MPISIQPYRPEHEAAVEEFNRRLVAANDPNLVFYKTSQPRWLPRAGNHPLYNEYFVAVDGSKVCGAYALKHEQVFIRGKENVAVTCYHHPLSEGIVNRSFASVGALMLKDALSRQPCLYALGMGGMDQPLPRMLKAVGWALVVVPFFFKIIRPSRFLKEMQVLRSSPVRSLAMTFAANTGAGWAAIRAAQLAVRVKSSGAGNAYAERVNEFSDWANDPWLRARDHFAMSAVRDTETLQRLYPPSEARFTRVRVQKQGVDIGWAVVGERRKDTKYGSLRVGSILDCWASPENMFAVTKAATRELESQRFDLILSNQSHAAWGTALSHCGFFKGPSNFIFAASKKYAQALSLKSADPGTFHTTRADGDGLPDNY